MGSLASHNSMTCPKRARISRHQRTVLSVLIWARTADTNWVGTYREVSYTVLQSFLYSTVLQCSRYCTALHCLFLPIALQFSLYCTVKHYNSVLSILSVLHCVLISTALQCSLYCTALSTSAYCTSLFPTLYYSVLHIADILNVDFLAQSKL